jgi:AcrR family transcriptional regulator
MTSTSSASSGRGRGRDRDRDHDAEAERAIRAAAEQSLGDAERAIDEAVSRALEKVAAKVAEQVGDKMVTKVAGQVGDKLDKKAARLGKRAQRYEDQAERHGRNAARAAKRAEVLDHIAAHLDALDVWTRPDPDRRRPRFSREQIAAAAVDIADREGFQALSMRRLAAELESGTMTLYHYVRTKDELLSLLFDAVMGEMVLGEDEELPDDWRDALTVLACRSRDSLLRHPWILDVTDDPAIGPNSVRHFDQTLQAVASLDVDLGTKLDIASMVDEYVFGYCLHHRNELRETSSPDEMIEYVNGLIENGSYPQLSRVADDIGLAEGWRLIEERLREPDRFERNLGCLLDGVQARLSR